MSKITVTHELDSYEDQDELKILMNASESHSTLSEIDNRIRNEVKHVDHLDWPESVYDFLDSIREEIHDSHIPGI